MLIIPVARLPILVQPEFIRKALAAGKHVISEKPIAKDIETAQELLHWYHANVDTKKVTWGVAENFRFYNSFLFAAEQVKKLGRVQNFRVNSHVTVKPDSRYYRKNPNCVPCYVDFGPNRIIRRCRNGMAKNTGISGRLCA